MTMKRVFISAATLLVAVGLITGPAGAAKKAKAQNVKLYFHGTEQVGEVDLVNNLTNASYLPMDATEPDAPAPRSINAVTWAGDPQMWNDCAGMFTLPVWKGFVAGTISGDMKLTLHTVSAPRQVEVEVWPDVSAQTCASNDVAEGNYPKPVATTVADIPAGPGVTEIVMKGVKFKAAGSMIVQITPIGPGGPRILYDAADYASSLEFKCAPTQGKSCTP
jgi:hypothetical protein